MHSKSHDESQRINLNVNCCNLLFIRPFHHGTKFRLAVEYGWTGRWWWKLSTTDTKLVQWGPEICMGCKMVCQNRTLFASEYQHQKAFELLIDLELNKREKINNLTMKNFLAFQMKTVSFNLMWQKLNSSKIPRNWILMIFLTFRDFFVN